MITRSTKPSYRAYAWRTGVLHVGRRAPAGALKLFTFTSRRAAIVAERVLQANARLAYDNTTLLVPGVPEADTDDQALDALVEWAKRVAPKIARRLPKAAFRSEVRA